MPQQLKQFVENSKRQKEFKIDFPEANFEKTEDIASFEGEIEFGKHFLFNSNVSSDESGKHEENNKNVENDKNGENGNVDGSTDVLDMSLHE